MSEQKFDFGKCKYGLFVHYVHGLSFFSDGRRPRDLGETVASFDVEGFAKDIAETGVQFLIFTAWHMKTVPLYPSKVNARWRGIEPIERDLLGEIIDAVNARGVRVILYTHPRDGHDFGDTARASTGWGEGHREGGGNDTANPATFDYARWNQYVKELYTELADRYAHKICGFYTDGMGPWDGRSSAAENNFQVVDYLMLRDIIKSRNPDAVIIQNHFGYIFSNDFEMPEGYFGYEREALGGFVERLPAAEKSLAMSTFKDSWMPKLPLGDADSSYAVPIENAIRFVLFNASCTLGGGTVYAAGPYCEGNVWANGAIEYLKRLGKKVSEYKESALDAKVSKSFPTISGDTLESLGNRFFTTSNDEKYEYLHLMGAQKEVTLPRPIDGATLHSPLSLTSGLAVSHFDGKKLTLTGEFDPIDSVIRFERTNPAAPRFEWINNSNKRFKYSEGWKYHNLDRFEARQKMTLGCFESDLHQSLTAGASVFVAFEGSAVEIYGRGQVSVFVDGVKLADIECGLKNNLSRNLLYTATRLYGGWHTLYLVTDKEFHFDAIKVIK